MCLYNETCTRVRFQEPRLFHSRTSGQLHICKIRYFVSILCWLDVWGKSSWMYEEAIYRRMINSETNSNIWLHSWETRYYCVKQSRKHPKRLLRSSKQLVWPSTTRPAVILQPICTHMGIYKIIICHAWGKILKTTNIKKFRFRCLQVIYFQLLTVVRSVQYDRVIS